jgi:hypothetical protein
MRWRRSAGNMTVVGSRTPWAGSPDSAMGELGHSLESTSLVSGLRELGPVGGKPQPRFLVEWVDGLLRQFAAFLGLLAEAFCVGLDHCAEIMHEGEHRPTEECKLDPLKSQPGHQCPRVTAGWPDSFSRGGPHSRRPRPEPAPAGLRGLGKELSARPGS